MFVIEDQELFDLTQKQYEVAYKVFYERTRPEEKRLMCAIYDVFDEPGNQKHNCLGCNFDDMTEQIAKFLFICKDNTALLSLHQSFSIYALLLNSVWERISDVFEIISLPESYLVRNFGPFIRIRRWANFFKHPKAFAWRVHHPVYTFEDSSHSKAFIQDPSYLKIDDEFLKKYYTSDKSKGLTKEFNGHETKVVVIFPSIEALTNDICDCLEKFVEIITQNKVYQEVLDEKSTFINYFIRQDEGAISS